MAKHLINRFLEMMAGDYLSIPELWFIVSHIMESITVIIGGQKFFWPVRRRST